MSSPIVQAIQQICDEKGISYDAVIETIEAALAAAYRKDFGQKNQNIKVTFEPEMGGSRVFDVKTVVSDEFVEKALKEMEEKAAAAAAALAAGEPLPLVEPEMAKVPVGEVVASGEPTEEEKYNPKLHLSLTEARAIKPDAQIGDTLTIELEVPAAYGRMAAQTAKQVITQRLREAERFKLFEEFKGKEGEMLVGVVQRREGRVMLVDLGRVTGVMLSEDQMPTERYNPGDRVKVFVTAVAMTSKGPEIRLTRTHPEMVRKLFMLEIPEVASGAVLIHAIAREPGSRTKVAVSSTQENVDPIGSCIGQRGSRIQTIISEIGGEKIDIIEWNADAAPFIKNALSPARVERVELDEPTKTAKVLVARDQLSLAIGRGGQNVRLAARLTGWKINVVEAEAPAAEEAVAEAPAAEAPAEEAPKAE
ncbi:transcription termination/antitermination protein NusA [Patescibacteria group bacterium]|nr:MAG: transcription termination/antitermination protein NusA [Patescibacteria group bacterium]